MPTLQAVIEELSGAPARIERAVRVSVTRTAVEIQNSLRANSPVKSGALQYGWRVGRASSSTGILASVKIINAEKHAEALEYGVDPASTSHPWAISMRKGKSKGTSGIVLKGSRIWSSSAVGGVSERSISASMVTSLGRDVANSIISSLSEGK